MLATFLVPMLLFGGQFTFNYSADLFGPPCSLSVSVTTVNRLTGEAAISGVDTRHPSIPFTFVWGDGTINDGWFPQSHCYADHSKDYSVLVASHYSDGSRFEIQVPVLFVAPKINPDPHPDILQVRIPIQPVKLDTRLNKPPANLSCFTDDDFSTVPRATIEHVLSIAAMLQMDFANNDVYRPEDDFRQVVLRDTRTSCMYSLWFTTPVSVAARSNAFSGIPAFSSLFHEMGHNVTLNAPATFGYGGKIDGNANAIYSETLAQIFQHATAFEILNCPGQYGLDPSLAASLASSAHESMRIVRSAYDSYVGGGKHFCSWNDPSTQADETFDTFMSIAYVFFEHAEKQGTGYRAPLKRMMELLELFDADLLARYDPQHNNGDADAFRSTLLATAVSEAFGQDLFSEFKALSFPLERQTYDGLMARLSKKKTQAKRE